jgi:hypothetical protein
MKITSGGVNTEPDSERDGLDDKQRAALDALLTEPSVAKAAEKCGVTERTMYRWMTDNDFARAYTAAKRQMFGQAIGLAQRYASLAVQTLAKMMVDPTAPAAARVKAATAVLTFGREGVEIDDLQDRMRVLEATLAETMALAGPDQRDKEAA